jgi:hypothetical protein
MNGKAIPVTRGSGNRVPGGIYAECGLSPEGLSVEHYLVDPPDLQCFDRMGVTPAGVRLVERKGVFHVYDWINSAHYPDLATFVEEVRRFGLCRRLPRSLRFDMLTDDSRLILIHSRAYVANFEQYASKWHGAGVPCPGHPHRRCPKGMCAHDRDREPSMCAGVWWQDVTQGVAVEGDVRSVRVNAPSFSHLARRAPVGVVGRYLPAVFGTFPITRLVVVRGDDEEHQRGLDAAGKSLLPVDLESA